MSNIDRRDMIKRLLMIAAVPAVAKVFAPGTSLERLVDDETPVAYASS